MFRNTVLKFTILAAALSFASLACAHRPLVADLHTSSRDEALRRSDLALRLRFGRVHFNNRENGCLSTDGRLESTDPPRRVRAFLALTPGVGGWAAEVTVLRERLDADDANWMGSAGARWISDGRDEELERFLVATLEASAADTGPVFVTDDAPRPSSSPTTPLR